MRRADVEQRDSKDTDYDEASKCMCSHPPAQSKQGTTRSARQSLRKPRETPIKPSGSRYASRNYLLGPRSKIPVFLILRALQSDRPGMSECFDPPPELAVKTIQCGMCKRHVPLEHTREMSGRILCFGCLSSWYDEEEE